MKTVIYKVIDFIKSEKVLTVMFLVAVATIMLASKCGDDSMATVQAMAVVAGVAGGRHVTAEPLTLDITEKESPSLLRNEIDQRIVKIRPMATPIDQISRYSGARKAGSMVVDYYSVDTKPFEAEVVSASNTPGDQNGFVSCRLTCSRPDIFEPSETILFPTVEAEADGEKSALVVYVVAKSVSGDLTVIAANNKNSAGKYAVPEITAGTKMVRMGRAAAELDVQTAQFESLPVKSRNYCQIFKAQVEQSTYQKIANKEVGWGFSDQEECAIIDMRRGIEANLLFGYMNRIYDPTKKNEIMLTGGIWNQTSKTYEYTPKSLDFNALVDISRMAFTGNAGSSKKILIAGTGLIEQLNKLEHTKVVGAEQTVTKWGLDFSEIVTKFGRLYVISSEIFDLCGHENDGMIIDPEYITKYCHVPFRTDRLDLQGAGVRNTDAIVITEASCLVLRYPEAHMRIVAKG